MKSTRYTIDRTEDDIKNLERVRKQLITEDYDHKYRTDSNLYRALPELYLDAVKRNQDLVQWISKLQLKLEKLEELKDHVCSIMKICKEKNK